MKLIKDIPSAPVQKGSKAAAKLPLATLLNCCSAYVLKALRAKSIILVCIMIMFAGVKAKAQNDLASPSANMLTIPAGSIIIPMDSLNYYTVSGSKYFNLNTYGLIVTLLDSSIAIHWYITAGKSKDGIDFTASMQQYAPTSSATTVSKNLRAGPMVIFPADTTGVWAAINAFNIRAAASTTGRTKTKVNVYKTTAAISADCRYVLTEKPTVAVLNDGGFATVQTQFFKDANVPSGNYTTIPGHDLMSGCYTIATQPHNTTAYANNLDSIQSFLNQGGNFFAECRGLLNYENFTPSGSTPGFFQTTEGITLDNKNTSLSYPNPDVGYSQFLGQFNATTIGGGEQTWILTPASGSTPASAFKNNGYSVVSNGTPTSGSYKYPHYSATAAKLLSNSVAGGMMFYGGGHDYSSSSGSGVDFINGERMYFNAVLTPCGTRSFCSRLFFWINLSVTQTATTPCYQDTVTFTVIAKHNGPSSNAATGVVVYDTIPAGFTYAGYTATKGTYSSSTGMWSVGSITENDSAILYLKAVANTTTTSKMTAHIDGNQYDTYNSNDTNSVYIKVNSLPAASVASNATICAGNSVSIGALSVAGDTYSWSSSPSGFSSTLSNPTVSPTVTTAYTLTETKTSTGCHKSNVMTVTVNALPAAAVIASTSICSGSSISIGGTAVAGSTYSWTSAPAGFTSTLANPSVSPATTTTYTVTETNSNGCVKSNSVTITVKSLPAAAVASNITVCAGTSVSIGAASVGGSTYSWTSSPSGFTSTLSNPGVTPSATTTYTLIETGSNGCTKSNAMTVTVNALPAAAVIANTSICMGSTISIGSAAVSGSTYSWASSPIGFISASSNPPVSPAITTTYILTETNSSGCVKSNSVTVTVNPLPAAAVIASASICSGSSVSIGAAAVPGSTYSWTSSPAGFTSTSSNPSVAPTATTTYILTETSSNGCVNSNPVTITVNALPAAAAGSNASICAGNSITIGASSVAGSTYSWVSSPSGFTSASSNPAVTPATTTTYTLTETNSSGCVNSNSVTITVNALPSATVAPNASICLGSSVSIGSSAVAGSTYSWSSSPSGFSSTSSNPSVSPSANTTYTLTETNSYGCVKANTVSVTVNSLPAAAVASNTSICSGSSVSIGSTAVSGSTYSWTSSPSGFTSTSANPTVSPAGTATYTLTETNSNGCTKSNSVTVTVNALPAAGTIASASICMGTSLSIGASPVPGSTYSWVSSPSGFTSAAADPTVSPTSTTTYILTETNLNGCVKTDSVTITVNPLPSAGVRADTTICAGDTVSLGTTAVAGSTYSWSSSPAGFSSSLSDPKAAPAVTTAYTLTETNAYGCVNSNTITITVNSRPSPAVSGNAGVCEDDAGEIYSTANVSGDTYSWAVTGGVIQSGQGTHSITVDWGSPGTGSVSVTETNASGCSQTVTYSVTIYARPGSKVIFH